MDDRKKRLVGHGPALGHPEDPVVLVGPEQLVAPHIQAPASDPADGLRPVQVRLAFPQRLLRILQLGDIHPVNAKALRFGDEVQRLIVPFTADRHLPFKPVLTTFAQDLSHRAPVTQPGVVLPALRKIREPLGRGGVAKPYMPIPNRFDDRIGVEPGEGSEVRHLVFGLFAVGHVGSDAGEAV